ncbi:DNA polymerase delta subunit 3 [Anopheles ziemanni]|uniref:DNA polymerase delta subunit 3 n=1 Tax=Anopheles coustani TaxID=139045 RepID=UPI00265B341A|nr:DNA polymerase delta subunit 3 [Anopheles coustani]XP_058167790.1 DNA polymerase delta subunit 3 [Anopheles ziemanni]
MDADLLKTCHREIEHIVFDAKEKVTARRISNNWDVGVPQAVDVLQKWIDEQKDKAKLSLEYVVRGVDKNGNAFMTLVKEDKLQNVCKLYPKSVKMLYSAEVASEIRPMNVSVDSEFSIKNLRLEPQKRQIDHRSAAPVQSESLPVKQEKKPEKKNLFATVSKPSSKPVVKEEKPSLPPTPATVKTEPLTQPATTKISPKKQSPKKDTKKVVNGKGSISSFFSSKPGQTAASSQAASTSTIIKQEAESPTSASSQSTTSHKQTKPAKTSEPIKEQEKTRKRTITDDDDEARSDEDKDVIPSTPQEEKREGKKRAGKPLLKRKKTANPSKKSRIMEICDSSSDDEMNGRDAAEEKRKERLVEFDEEMAEPEVEEKQKRPSPEKPVENDSNSANRTRGKVKKMVTKTFTDDDGYLITVKEWEMVSEDESQENGTDKETGVATTATGPAAKSNKTPSLGSQTKAPSGEKKATPPTPKTKQGSIMSFFAKK